MSKKVLGSGQYSKRVYKQAARLGAAVKTSRDTVGGNRKHFRDDLRDWADPKAVDESTFTITDPRKLIPYRGPSYRGAVQALLSKLPSKAKDLKGTMTKDFGCIMKWSGMPRNEEIKGIISTPWVWATLLFEVAKRLNPKLISTLRERHSKRPGVKKSHRKNNPLDKFCENIVTIQRTGGINPCGKPLADCKFAIDHQWAFHGSKPEKQYRLVVGRNKSINMRKTDLK